MSTKYTHSNPNEQLFPKQMVIHLPQSKRAVTSIFTNFLFRLQKIFNLTLFVLSSAPLSILHSTTKDTELLGYKIPSGTLIIPLLYSVSYDPKYWTEPEKFNPDRFLNKDGHLIKNDAFIPFSVGEWIYKLTNNNRQSLPVLSKTHLVLFEFGCSQNRL